MKSEQKLTIPQLHKLYRAGEKLVAISVYDWLMGKLADESGVHLALVGDSLGMNVLGYDNTIAVTLEESLHHTAAVARGVKSALVIGDMPFLTFQLGPEETLRNAGRYMQEAGADGVKLEGGLRLADTVKRLVDCGIPVLGHIGLLPQRVIAEGGYRVHGRTDEESASLLEDAKSLQNSGAFAIVLECIPAELSKRITDSVDIPTIGIGAGPECNGQIQVGHDILGMNPDWAPKHSKQYARFGQEMRTVFAQYKRDVQEQLFPDQQHTT